MRSNKPPPNRCRKGRNDRDRSIHRLRHRGIDVEAPAEQAFRVFTDGIGSWWDPRHHLLDSELVSMTFEPHVGGHIIDRYADGRECRWARVLSYDPPRRVVFSWDINLHWQLESDPAKTSEVEVVFTASAAQRTHVTLTHHNLDRHGAGWQSMRDAVEQGWTLDRYAAAASAHGPAADAAGG